MPVSGHIPRLGDTGVVATHDFHSVFHLILWFRVVRVGDIGDLYFMVLSEGVMNKCHLTCDRETSVERIRLKILVDAVFLFF